MYQLNNIRETLSKNKNFLKSKYNIKSVGIFGSYSRSDYTDKSDIDILVDFEKPIGIELPIYY